MADAKDFAINYERFILTAFEIENSRDIKLKEDPARLADANLWRDEKMYQIKIAVGYALLIYYWFLQNTPEKPLGETPHECRDTWIDDLWKAESLDDIKSLIEDVNKVADKHL
jgi:hypothetical protein